MSFAWLAGLPTVWLKRLGYIAAVFMLVACGGGGKAKTSLAKGCALNSDCNGGLVCSFGLCHAECVSTKDCPAGQRCVEASGANVCQLPDESSCTFNTDCSDPLVCAIDRQCRNQCQGDRDCVSGQICAQGGVCAEPTEVTSDGTLKGAVDAGAGGAGGAGGGATGGGGTTAGGAGGAPSTCTPGGACTPTGQPCHTGEYTCQGDTRVCTDTGNATDGTNCGTDKVCSAGACVACQEGGSCTPATACRAGVLTCSTGPVCNENGNAPDGTDCGTDQVCSGGSCVACKAGDACDPGINCRAGTLSCASGPTCVPGGTVAAGTSCGTDMVCDANATCVSCVQDAPCTPTNDCHTGHVDCVQGPACVDEATNAPDLTPCGSSGYSYCNAGVCAACTPYADCVPANPCHTGQLYCNNPPTCQDTATNLPDGTSCGTNKTCIAGSCLTNDRVLTVTAGDQQSAATDAQLASTVTLHLVDGSGAAVPGAKVTVTASAGAWATASNTDTSGNSKVTVRVGRAIGTYTFTASAPAASSVQFTASAVAPTDKNIFTVVNVNHTNGNTGIPGPGTAAQLYYSAQAVAAATDGTLYVADYCSVLALSPQGHLTILAGNPTSCGSSGDNGAATSALLSNPTGLAIDETNNLLYIADSGNAKVRVVDLASGTIGTYAGGGANTPPYGDGGPADQAYIGVNNVSVAANGDLYVSDSAHNSIRKVDFLTSQISTWLSGAAGCSTGKVVLDGCSYGGSCSVAWDAAGKAFVAGQFCGGGLPSPYGVVRVDGNNLTHIAGWDSSTGSQSDGVVATSAYFPSIPQIAFDKAGNLYLSIQSAQKVKRIDAVTTKVTTVAGDGTAAFLGDYGPATSGELYNPTDIAFDSNNNLYIADSTNYAVRAVWNLGGTVTPTGKMAITGGTGQTVSVDAPFNPLAVKLTDAANANITGVTVTWERKTLGAGLLASAPLIAQIKTSLTTGVSSTTGRVGLAPADYTFQASYSDIHGTPVTGSPATFTVTATAPAAGTIFTMLNPTHVSGAANVPGPATLAQSNYALGVAAASDGSMYFSEYCRVLKLSPAGELSVVAGTNSCGFSGDNGPAISAQVYNPEALALDETNGILYIADTYNNRVRMVTLADGNITTLAGGGSATVAPYGDGGPATTATLSSPRNLSLDASGNLYIVDSGRDSIRMVDLSGYISTWLKGSGTCTGTVQLYSIGGLSTAQVVWLSGGAAYISAQICGTSPVSYAYGIVKRASGGALTHIAGTSNSGATGEGLVATGAYFPDMGGIAVDSTGNIYVNTRSGNKIRKITIADGKVNTIAGDGTATYSGDYVASTSAQVYYPYGMTFNAGGHLVFADEYNYAFRQIW